MAGVVLAGECLGEIRIALPVSVEIAIIQARKAVKLGATVAGEASVLGRVAEGVADHLRRSGVAGEVSLAGGIAPCAFWIPMPSLHEQFGVLAVTDDAPAGFQNLLDLVWRKKDVGRVTGDAIDGRAQRIQR